jgi:HD superfamily phosphohydrolase YqeK
MARAAPPSLEFPDWAQISPRRRAHVARVAELCVLWAGEMKVPVTERARWLKAVALHDALKSAPRELLRELAPDGWPVKVMHGPAAAERAARDGEHDRGILDAVRFHSVGYAGWERVGQILYLADYLEPGRSYHTAEHDRLAQAVPLDLSGTLRTVAALRVADTVAAGRPLLAETVAFWNSLAHE